ncbi:MAG: ABC transporter ATP-binding protein [Clostridiales bacterium]|nr:ABC transporter ATP-binding protein [Clostridiales bacterium]
MLYVFLMQISIDQLSVGVGIWTVVTTILLFFSFELLLYIGGDLLYFLYFEPCQTRIIANVNIDICEHMKRTDYKCFDDPNYYNEYTVAYAKYASKSIEAFFNLSNSLALIVTVGSLVGYVLSSTVYVLIITFISVIVKVWVSKIVNKIQIRHDEESAPIERKKDYYYETLCSKEAAMDIKSTNIYNILVDHYCQSFQQHIEIKIKYGKQLSFWSLIQGLSTSGSSAIIRIIICGLIIAGKVGVGSFVSLLSAANSLAWKIEGVSKRYTSLNKSVMYGERIRRFIDQPSQIERTVEDKGNHFLESDSSFSIMFKDVCFNYENSNFAIKNINLKIKKGEKVAIVGKNGGGKTTLTKLLLRLYDPPNGDIMINGISLKEVNLSSYRSNVGIAFQESHMYSLSLRENLSSYETFKDVESLGRFSKTSIDTILTKSGATLDTDVTKKFDKDGIMLSGGEMQKMAVSRLFTKEFGLLIFDEPSSALDPFDEENLNQMIFNKDNSTTTILISHRLSNVVKADRIYVMEEGRIVEEGTHSELIEKKESILICLNYRQKIIKRVDIVGTYIMENKIILPFEINPLSVMYHNLAFPLGVIQGNAKNDITPWLCCKFINCSFNPFEKNKFFISLSDNWGIDDEIVFYQQIQLFQNTYDIVGINMMQVLKDMLAHGCYVGGYYNEEYIPGKKAYGVEYFPHDYLLIGFDNEKEVFYSAGYLTKRFVVFEIPFANMECALNSLTCRKPILNFYQYNTEAKFILDIEKIISALQDYLSSSNSLRQSFDGVFYGLNAIEGLGEHYILKCSKNSFDHRYTKGLMEHKYIMLKRIKYLCNHQYITDNEYISKAEKVFEYSAIIHNLGIKFKLLGDSAILKKIMLIIQKIKEVELSYLISVKNELELYKHKY